MASKPPTVNFNIAGTIQQVGPMQIMGKFKKRDVILADQFGNQIAIEATFETAEQMDSFPAGTQVNAEFFISSRAWTDPKTGNVKWFTSAVAKSVNLAAQVGGAPAQAAPAQATSAQATPPPPVPAGDPIPY